jgi:hypothetical protein
MEQTKPAVGILELPTGVRLEGGEVLKELSFRELAGPEEDILASQMSASQKISLILSNCAIKLGTLSDPFQIKKQLENLIETDRWFYLVKLRCLSLGPDYAFDTICPECKQKDKKAVDISHMNVINPPTADKIFHVSNLPSGAVVRWKNIDGQISAKIEKMATPNNAATVALYARVTEFNEKPVTLADIKNLSMKDRNELRKEIDKQEGELDDEIECTCPECGHEYKLEMKLDPQSFFFP